MKLIGKILAFTIVAVMLIGLGWGGYIGIKFLVNQYDIINPQIAAVLIISAVVILSSALVISGAIRSLDNGSDKQIHPEKAVLYSRFIESWYDIKDGRYDYIKELEKHMLLWANEDVLQEYLTLIELIEAGKEKQQLVEQVKEVVITIRKDLGAETKDTDIENMQKLLDTIDSVSV